MPVSPFYMGSSPCGALPFLAYFLVSSCRLCLVGIRLALACAEWVRGLAMFWRWRSRRWQNKNSCRNISGITMKKNRTFADGSCSQPARHGANRPGGSSGGSAGGAPDLYIGPIVIDETSDAQKAPDQGVHGPDDRKTIKINEYQTGKVRWQDQIARWLIRTKLMPARKQRAPGRQEAPRPDLRQGGIPTQEIVGELIIMNGTLRAPWVRLARAYSPGTPVAEKITIANYQYAIGNEAKAPDWKSWRRPDVVGVIARRSASAGEEKEKSKHYSPVSKKGPRALLASCLLGTA